MLAASNIHAQIARHTDVFISVLGETVDIRRWPAGDRTKEETFAGAFLTDSERGSNEVYGDGSAITESTMGENERRTGVLECASTVRIRPGDSFVIYGEEWQYLRHIGRDPNMQGVTLIKSEKRLTKRPHIRGVVRKDSK